MQPAKPMSPLSWLDHGWHPSASYQIQCQEQSTTLNGAQLTKVLNSELTLPIRRFIMWSDSTTVLKWIQSKSQQYKVFVGTRVVGNTRAGGS